jgi:hypothetical protein
VQWEIPHIRSAKTQNRRLAAREPAVIGSFSVGIVRSMHARAVAAQPLDLLLHQQFTAFQFYDFQVIDRGMSQAVTDFTFEGLVTLLQFREMRLQRHAECLLNLCPEQNNYNPKSAQERR